MKRRKLLSVMIIGMMVVANASTTFATPTMKYSKESIESYVDEKDFGGKVISQENTKFSLDENGTNSKVKENENPIVIIDESKNADSIEIVKVTPTTDNATVTDNSTNNTAATITTTKNDIESAVSDKVVLTNVQQKEQATLQAELRKQRESKFSWLTEQGVDLGTISEIRLKVLEVAYNNLGIWYRWGGTTPSGFDCSGYTQYCLRNGADIELPRTTYEQVVSSAYTRIPISEAKAGDIIFGHGLGHTGIFLKDNGGNITIMHAPETGQKTKISVYTKPAYAYRYTA